MLFLGVLDSDGDCQWNEGHLNAWDGPIDATCNPGYAVAGFYSVHNNGKEDRKWKMNCCKVHRGSSAQVHSRGGISALRGY